MKLKTEITILALLLWGVSFAQQQEFQVRQKIEGVTAQWHKIILPRNLYGKTKSDLSDIRIYGLTSGNDTIEAPYLLQTAADKISDIAFEFKIINTAKNKSGYFYTFEIPSADVVNSIKLAFKPLNFDWKIKIEGSQNQTDWFTIVEDYRILSIKNSQVDFKFTDVDLPESNYRFYRVFIPVQEKPDLTSAKISNQVTFPGTFISYKTEKIAVVQNRKYKLTTIDLALQQAVPVSYIKINCKNNYDYYRRVNIEYATDSIKTEKGWICNYDHLISGTLNPLNKNEFRFNSVIMRKLRITIENKDNQPLAIGAISIKGFEHSLAVRFTEPADYFLFYGDKTAPAPQYDITEFTDKIPPALTVLALGKEEAISKKASVADTSFFKNKMWLWIIMGIIILILGWFSSNMIKNTK